MNKFLFTGVLAACGALLPLTLHAHSHGHGHGHGHAAQDSIATAAVSRSLQVSACWIRAIPAPAPSAGYFVVKNAGDKDVSLQSAGSASYGMVMLHQTTHQDGMSRMSEAHDIVIPAHGELEFKPGGYHAMLEKPQTAPAVGSEVPIDFLFSTGEKATAQCEVKPANTRTK